jgi:hypothetical protein
LSRGIERPYPKELPRRQGKNKRKKVKKKKRYQAIGIGLLLAFPFSLFLGVLVVHGVRGT